MRTRRVCWRGSDKVGPLAGAALSGLLHAPKLLIGDAEMTTEAHFTSEKCHATWSSCSMRCAWTCEPFQLTQGSCRVGLLRGTSQREPFPRWICGRRRRDLGSMGSSRRHPHRELRRARGATGSLGRTNTVVLGWAGPGRPARRGCSTVSTFLRN